MIVLETKLKGTKEQYGRLDEAIRTSQFVRNSAIRYWIDNKGVGKGDLSKLCAVLAKEFEWAGKLNSMARQASAERAWQSIVRFYDNCKKGKPGKKGFPRFKKNTRSVEYKTSGWKLSDDPSGSQSPTEGNPPSGLSHRKSIAFTDGFESGRFEMWGNRDLNFYQISQIKRVRVVRRADGYYTQFCVDVEREIKHEYTGKIVGIDLGLEFFYTDSSGQTVANPRLLRKSEKRLKRLQRRVSSKKKGGHQFGDKKKREGLTNTDPSLVPTDNSKNPPSFSQPCLGKNRRKAINRMARQHLKVSRQRKDFAVKAASTLVQSNDLIAYENLQVRNMVRNHKLAKSISDASWSLFVVWLEYYAKLHKIVTVAVPQGGLAEEYSPANTPPQYTSQDCSKCGNRVQKTLSERTHQCLKCGLKMNRDWNAAKNILVKGLEVLGHKQSTEGHLGTSNAWGENHLWLVEGNFGRQLRCGGSPR